jgi:hypothetical protein
VNARLAVVALAAALSIGPARAEPRHEALAVTLAASGDRLSATLDLGPAFDAALERRVGNGLTNVVAVLVAVVPEGGGPAVAVAGRVAEVLFDVWDETYAVTVRDPRVGAPFRRTVADFETLRRLLSEARAIDLGPAAHLPPGRFRVEARVEVNPVSRELMERTRELLANPSVSGRPGAGSRSVLGAMAGYLLRDPGPGDDVVILRSRLLERGEVAAR